MADKVNRLAPTGNMDKDSDVRYVGKGDRKGDYIDARNIQIAGDAGGSAGDSVPTLGTTFGFNLGEVQQQNKEYRITFSGDATKQHEIRLLSTNRDANVANGSGANGGIAFNGTQADFITQWNASNTGNMYVSYPTATTAVIGMSAYNFYQFYIESTGTDDIEVICIKEAIPVDLAGPLKDIGSYDLLGDLFVFSTTQDNEPTELGLTVTTVDSTSGVHTGPLTFLTFNAPHGLVQGQWIRITNSQAPWLNGLFVVAQIVSPTKIGIPTVLAWGGTRPLFTVGDEIVRVNPFGIGEIGVAQKDDNTDTWTYIRLLRSVELNFVSKHTIDCFFDKSKERISSYYTDNYNRPRVFYYNGLYENDGAVNDVNIYSYGSINRETSLQNPSESVSIEVIDQIDFGGNLIPGTKRYALILETVEGDESPISSFTPPMIVYKTDEVVSSTIYSNEIIGQSTSGNNSSKKNVIKLSGLNTEIYSYGKIICVEIVGGALTSNIINEFNILGREYIYEHTGFEEPNPVDIGSIFALSSTNSFSSIIKAKNIRSIDSRNVLSNVTQFSQIDFSVFTESIKHELIYDEFDESTLKSIGENQDPFVFKDKSGLMLNEVYRFGCRVHVPGFGWSSYYWIDDIKIDTDPINTSNPYGDNRRISGLSDFNLTDGGLISEMDALDSDPNARKTDGVYFNSSGTLVSTPTYVGVYRKKYAQGFAQSASSGYDVNCKYRSPKVKFHINWDYFIEGIGFLNLSIDAIEFGIGNINNSIKASGFGVMSCSIPSAPFPGSYFADSSIFQFPFNPYNGFTTLPISEQPSSFFDRDLIPNYPFIYNGGNDIIKANEVRDVVTFYSPESIIKGESEISSSNKLISIGSMQTYKQIQGKSTLNNPEGYFSLLQPYGDIDFAFKTSHNINESFFISDEGSASVVFSNGDLFKVKSSADLLVPDMNDTPGNQDAYNYRIRNYKSCVFKLDSGIPNHTETHITKQQRGIVYCQLFKDESQSYPQLRDTNYKKIGSTTFFQSVPDSEITVNGGDTITSLFFFKEFSELNTDYTLTPAQTFSGTTKRQGSMIGLVCQTRINVKALNGFEDVLEKKVYPFEYGYGSYNFNQVAQPTTTADVERTILNRWRQHPTSLEINNVYEENSDYALNNNQLNSYAYNSFEYQTFGFLKNTNPSRVIFSERKIENSRVDYYRVFLPISYKDLDSVFGEINHHEDIGGELFTVQPRKYQLQYFNARGTLEASSSSVEVLLGDGSVLSRDGQTLSSYGTQHKWSCIKGYNDNGKDVLYWFNAENGLVMRFGEDGTRVISDRGMKAYFANYTKWVKGKHEPAFEQGIRGVWDDRRKEAVWTFIGWRNVNQAWQTANLVEVGEVVTNTNAPFDTYEQFPRFFRCTVVHQSSSTTEPGVGADWEQYWEQILYTDSNYYSIFTVCFNEMTNGFRCFYGHLPKTYLRWQNTFLSSHPVHRNLIFEHRLGEPTTWYGVDTFLTGNIPPKVEDAYVEMVVNELPEQSLRGVAVEYLSENAPDRIDYSTARQRTYDEAAQFEQRDDQWFAPIRNDITDTGDPDGDGAVLSGDYLRVKFTIFGGTYNLLHSIVVKIRDRFRRFNR